MPLSLGGRGERRLWRAGGERDLRGGGDLERDLDGLGV